MTTSVIHLRDISTPDKLPYGLFRQPRNRYGVCDQMCLSICLFVCLFVCVFVVSTVLFEPIYFLTLVFECVWIMSVARTGLKFKVRGQVVCWVLIDGRATAAADHGKQRAIIGSAVAAVQREWKC